MTFLSIFRLSREKKSCFNAPVLKNPTAVPFRNIVSRSEQVSESRKTIHLRFTIKKSILSSKNFPIQQNIGRTPEKVSPSFLRFPATLRLLLSFPSNLWLFKTWWELWARIRKERRRRKTLTATKKWRNENFGKILSPLWRSLEYSSSGVSDSFLSGSV